MSLDFRLLAEPNGVWGTGCSTRAAVRRSPCRCARPVAPKNVLNYRLSQYEFCHNFFACFFASCYCRIARQRTHAGGARARRGTAHAHGYRTRHVPVASYRWPQPPRHHRRDRDPTRIAGCASTAGRTVPRANQQPPGIGTTAPIRAPMIPSMIAHFAPEPQLVRTPTDRGACWPRGRAGRDGDARTTRCTQLPRTARKNSLTSRGIGLQTFAPLHASTHLLLL